MKKQKTVRMVMLAMFMAVMLIMNFSPLGYIITGSFSITLMIIPVVAGAVCLGPWAGAILGLLFGLTSFLQCFGIGYVIDPSAAILFSTSPLGTAVTCFVPRALMGLLVGLVFKGLKKIDKTRVLSYVVASVCGPLFNTAFFMTCYYIFFKDTILGGATVMTVFLSVLTLNFVIELVVNLIVGTALSKALDKAVAKFGA